MHVRHFFSRVLPACCTLALVLLFSGLHTPSAFANFTIEGDYWPNNFTIRYIKDPMTSKDSTGFNNGIGAWNGDTNAPVFFITSGSGSYVELWDQNNGSNGLDGYSWQNQTQYFGCTHNGVDLHIITYAAAYLNTYYTNQSRYNTGAVQSVAAHELGHDVGLGHDPNAYQLMYYSTDRYWLHGIDTPQSDDNAGTQYIYNNC